MLPGDLRPLKIDEKNLIRIGPKIDGGYVLDKRVIQYIETIISCGLNDNWDFEKHFLKFKSNTNIVAYDHTVNGSFWLQRFAKDILHFFLLKKLRLRKIVSIFKFFEYKFFFRGNRIHHKLKVGNEENKDKEITINKIFNNKQNVLLKIDIEYDEYKILENIIENSKKIEKIRNFIKDNKLLKLIHIHGNNYFGLDKDGLPGALELTFINIAKINIDSEKNTYFYPMNGIDYPNVRRHKDIKLTFTD